MALRTPEQRSANAAAMKSRLEAPPMDAKEHGIKIPEAATRLGVCRDTARKWAVLDGEAWNAGSGSRKHLRVSESWIRRTKERRRVQSPSLYMGHGGKN